MSDQISYDDPIWGLTPTELLIAYWSLTLTKPEIADKANITEGTVGTHLTSIYTELGLSELDDEVKRSLLNSRHGQALNSVVKDVDEEFTKYADKTKALQKKKAEVLKRKKEAESPTAEPGMQSPPPHPQPQSQTRSENRLREIPRIVWIIAGFLVLFSICGLFANNFFRGLFNQMATDTPQANTESVISATQTSPVVVRNPTQTTEPSVTVTFTSMPPTETTTPTVQPTALPLPITEDFSQQYSDLWRVIGNPIIIERTQNSYGAYSGVLTSGDSGLATIMIGNSAWTDLIVNLASSCWDCPVAEIGKIVIGVRVEDMNNMVALVCTGFYDCTWTIFEDGVEKKTPAYAFMAITENLTITVQGNSFTAVGESRSRGRVTNSMILEPQYQGKFTNGGVLLQVSPEREVDFIQIYPLP